MNKSFNVSADCKPNLHYMVNIDEKLQKIKTMIDKGEYFTINRARQYGKTTTLRALGRFLEKDYVVISLDFQMLSYADFEKESLFVEALAREISKKIQFYKYVPKAILNELINFASGDNKNSKLANLFECFSLWCEQSEKPLVLMIDEVDSATNNQVFLDFLAQLRGHFIDRIETPTFHSVVLAGVYDIKNLKLKMRSEQEHKYNSPWNIASKFDVDLSFSVGDIAGMLQQYEQDHQTGMDIPTIAKSIYDYTSGYPFLVSSICKLLDEKIPKLDSFVNKDMVWTEDGISEAIKLIVKEPRISLFDSMIKQLDLFPDLNAMLSDLLYQGKKFFYSPDIESINIGVMFGFLVEENGFVAIANRIFEMRLLNKYIAEEATTSESYQAGFRDRNQFTKSGILNMEMIFQKFIQHYTEVFGDNDERFVEEKGRKMFLMYLKPIINGVGNSYMESTTRDLERTDLIVDYLGKQYIIEMKIWRGNSYNTRGEKQLCDYLDAYNQKKGYMLSFNFNKKKNVGIQVIHIGDKTIVEAVV